MLDPLKIKNRASGLKGALNPKWAFLAVFFGLIALTWQCASIQQPMGGPKDSIPPTIVSENPPNLSRNFSAEKIVIEFDEYIKLSNPLNEISVSPDMSQPISPRVKRKTIEIMIPDSLEPNTTYTINFGKAIGDFNEGNPLPNYSYVFSTGDVIDSLAISGQVVNALTKLPEKEITVMLIPVSQDSIFGKRKANIYTLTDTAGSFRLKNLREDTYRIYALREENNDKIYNSPDELIGFLRDSIVLSKDTAGILLEVSKGIPKDFRLLDRRIDQDGKIRFAFNKRLENPSIRILSPEGLDTTKIVEYTANQDSAMLWVTDLSFDTIHVELADHGKPLDSVIIRRGRNDKYDRDFLLTDNLPRNRVTRSRHIELTSGSPVRSIDRSKIILMEDSVQRTNFQLIRDTTAHRRYILRYNWRPKRNYELVIEEGAFTGYFGDKNKSLSKTFTLEESENFGDILFKVTLPDTLHQYLVQLVSEKLDVVYQSVAIRQSGELPLRRLPGGKYTIRVVYDENNNGRWDPGDVYLHRQPERVWYIGKTFIIRANWEQEETIQVPR